ncbi:arginine exporter protein ArgO [Leminorella grimontii]|uniref:Arginine exporter protein ArgO n=2 Tax=Leminorella grimontii TaxID=82981 RepID=A0AAV5N687_9GAMM|nr:arginine exporter ArgO [Leminorella grimontii]KFC98214.1 LysE family transporter [Leminorella grimontii ATCC 33999 = DSM 5078]GKX57505.1 arginine exporter protein ArgO [Leminorella grimontii]GKX60985.1 arginine exporter protein ArgO [Leminorella grimontii]VFS56133.1 Arginine exporter protein ArgO [Leminorella grimontii]
MLLTYFQGIVLGMAMILPIGPQNAFVLSQGMRRQYPVMVAGMCALSDAALISLGVFGGGALLAQSPLVLQLVTWAGVLFLIWYGWGAFKDGLRAGGEAFSTQENGVRSRYRIIATVLAVTWLNPHVYIDTVVVLGSLGEQFGSLRLWFAMGAVTSSVVWFFSLALLAAWMSPWLQKSSAQRVINFGIGIVMWVIAFQLARHALGLMA